MQWFDSHSLCILTSSHSLDFVWDSVSPFWLSLFLSVSLMYTVVSLPSGWRMWGDPVWCSETPSCYVLTIMPVFYHGCLFEFRARKHFSIGCYCVLRPKVCVSDVFRWSNTATYTSGCQKEAASELQYCTLSFKSLGLKRFYFFERN